MNLLNIQKRIISFLFLIWERAYEIIKQPFLHKEMLWILLPSLITLLLIELYFGRHKKEELGWNTAFGNSIVLFFVSMNLFSFLYGKGFLFSFEQEAVIKNSLALVVLLGSVLLMISNFFHLIPRKFAFGISSALVINFIAVVSIIFVYSNITIDKNIAISCILLFFLLSFLMKLLQLLIPEAKDEEAAEIMEEIKEKEDELEEIKNSESK